MTYTQPLFPVLLVLTVASALLALRGRRSRVLLLPAVALLLTAMQFTARLLLVPLEWPYAPKAPADRNVQAIVVLSSSVFGPSPPRTMSMLGSDTYERCLYAGWLFRNWHPVPVLASGGGSLSGTTYSVVMAEEIVKGGVPPAMVWAEQISRSTRESAIYSAAFLRERGIHKIALVTEAYHMRRAEQCFRNAGLEVIPAPCGFRTNIHWSLTELIPNWQATMWNEDALHEFVALGWYKLHGWI